MHAFSGCNNLNVFGGQLNEMFAFTDSKTAIKIYACATHMLLAQYKLWFHNHPLVSDLYPLSGIQVILKLKDLSLAPYRHARIMCNIMCYWKRKSTVLKLWFRFPELFWKQEWNLLGKSKVNIHVLANSYNHSYLAIVMNIIPGVFHCFTVLHLNFFRVSLWLIEVLIVSRKLTY